jgi:cystathionine gamma-synthase
MLGCLAFPKNSTFQDGWIDRVRRYIAPPYSRDLARLAFEMSHYPNFVERTNKNIMELATFLKSHPAVKKLHWSYAEPFGANYRKLAGDGKPGCALAFELNGAIEPFYDKIRILKSPSFGTKFSLLCPYVQLAHYDLIQNNQGRNILASAGLSPELIRVSAGEEEVQEIISVFSEAL